MEMRVSVSYSAVFLKEQRSTQRAVALAVSTQLRLMYHHRHTRAPPDRVTSFVRLQKRITAQYSYCTLLKKKSHKFQRYRIRVCTPYGRKRPSHDQDHLPFKGRLKPPPRLVIRKPSGSVLAQSAILIMKAPRAAHENEIQDETKGSMKQSDHPLVIIPRDHITNTSANTVRVLVATTVAL